MSELGSACEERKKEKQEKKKEKKKKKKKKGKKPSLSRCSWAGRSTRSCWDHTPASAPHSLTPLPSWNQRACISSCALHHDDEPGNITQRNPQEISLQSVSTRVPLPFLASVPPYICIFCCVLQWYVHGCSCHLSSSRPWWVLSQVCPSTMVICQ